MSIAKPFTFVANTYAKASEVNADFDTVYSQVNTNISAIAQNATDIDNLENNKADINGSSAQRFAVADAITNSDAINKSTLRASIANSIDYISGFIITKDSGSPNDTIIVSEGSCYDSTHTAVLNLANSLSKQNANQASNATYYVYVIGNATGSSVDILISESSVTPALPSGYILFRQIGYYTTNGSAYINQINNYSNSIKASDILNSSTPNYSAGWGISLPYSVTQNGYIYAGVDGIGTYRYVYVNGKPVVGDSAYSGGVPVYSGSTFRVSSGDYVTCDLALGNYYFYPMKGGI